MAVPTLQTDKTYITTLVAVLGTTISPYLFFWQSSQEAEDQRVTPEREKLLKAPEQAEDAHRRIRLDTYAGMALSNLVGLAIIITTAATLHAHGVTDIESSTQAATALKPIAGRFAFFVFAFGIIGTGLLAVPVLAGSAAYAIGEARRWPVGLAREPRRAKSFYATLAVATALGVAFNLAHIDPIAALFWSAVINGIVAVPVMALMMHMAGSETIMRQFAVRGPLNVIGWIATAAMAASVVAMGVTSLL
jgi:Mn2+/Fe2+ NRAMP family transporter